MSPCPHVDGLFDEHRPQDLILVMVYEGYLELVILVALETVNKFTG